MSEERKISAVIITYNEENNIKRCLTSLKDIADEIIVVDSFSTDKTEAICAEFGVRFVKHKKPAIFLLQVFYVQKPQNE